MTNYTSQYQLKIKEFANLYQLNLNPSNRWIQLGFLLPWDDLVKVFQNSYSQEGRKNTNPRWIIGIFIIKHKLKLSDEEVLQTVSENPYMQFFLGLDNFSPEILFSPSVLVDVRKRISNHTFEDFNELLIRCSSPQVDGETEPNPSSPNLGKLKIDATVADQYIRYPNDLGLLNEAREKTEKIVDLLWDEGLWDEKQKPRTYRKLAHKRYLAMAKQKRKPKNKLRMEIRYQSNCVQRNMKYIDKMLDNAEHTKCPLDYKHLRQLWVIKEHLRQQQEMYQSQTNRCDHRIVSISQPHVRPIVRGKQGKNVEFGAKLGLSLANGYFSNETLSWEAYNESSDLKTQAEAYKALYGAYPELIQADKIYWTNENRAWCKENNIRITAVPKGRPKEQTREEIRKQEKEYAERNQVEGKIGNAKQALSLNQIKAKLKKTSQAWISIIVFVLNLSQLAKANGFHF